MLDGFEDLSAENQAKIKEGILKGELDEADKTNVSDLVSRSCAWVRIANGILMQHSLLNGEVNEVNFMLLIIFNTKINIYQQEQNEVNGSPEKTKDAKTKNKKRSRAESDEEEEVPGKKTKKTKGGATAKKEPTDEKPTKRGRARKTVKEESPEEEAFEDQPAKRSRARKVDEETAGTEKPAKKSKKMAAVVKYERDEEKTGVTDLQEDSQVQLPAKRARGKAASEKPKRGRKKKIADDED